jgi:hypothetical protein
LNVIGKTLGVDYFSSEILEPTLAQGEISNDPGSCRDVTPERFMKLEKELVRGKAEVVRLSLIFEGLFLINRCTTEQKVEPAVCHIGPNRLAVYELGISPPELDDCPFITTIQNCQLLNRILFSRSFPHFYAYSRFTWEWPAFVVQGRYNGCPPNMNIYRCLPDSLENWRRSMVSPKTK